MPQLTEEQRQEAVEKFRTFDKNGDGHIDSSELKSVLQLLGQVKTDREIKEMINQMDIDGNGKVECREFLRLLEDTYETKEEIQANQRAAFRVFDKDGNGFITTDELRLAMTSMGEKMSEKEVDQMIREADRNGDGRVDYNEFIRLITSD
ncbi:putative N-acetyltransferase 8B [Bulinus truncatus]|nr:putative N-acetyltransferase 8B [Bulinus truncatus]